MHFDANIVARLDALVLEGEAVLRTRREPSAGFITSDFVDVQFATKWMTSCQNFLSRAFGDDAAHTKRFAVHFCDYPKWPDAQQAFGVMLAARDDVKSGSFFQIRTLIEADLFSDLLDQAEHLASRGYLGPAAVIAGCVLEDALRKLCVKQNISLPANPKLDLMNAELAKAGVYSKLTQKKVTALADIRNNAAHGHWQAFDANDVTGLIADTTDFLQKHCS